MEAESPPVVIVDVVGVVVVGVPLEGAFLPLMMLRGGAGAHWAEVWSTEAAASRPAGLMGISPRCR